MYHEGGAIDSPLNLEEGGVRIIKEAQEETDAHAGLGTSGTDRKSKVVVKSLKLSPKQWVNAQGIVSEERRVKPWCMCVSARWTNSKWVDEQLGGI